MTPTSPLGSQVPDDASQDLVGTIGWVTVPIVIGHPGEVVVPVRGGTEAFAAWSDEPVAKNTRVVVVECRTARSVSVSPLNLG
ncbi:MAG: hypothetical protein DLM54_04095 [Acidimicrobiales bacterium]|nr:MAG: hypothetical protein DLM54_04095 [Acidimicrobiales bacterium]